MKSELTKKKAPLISLFLRREIGFFDIMNSHFLFSMLLLSGAVSAVDIWSFTDESFLSDQGLALDEIALPYDETSFEFRTICYR